MYKMLISSCLYKENLTFDEEQKTKCVVEKKKIYIYIKMRNMKWYKNKIVIKS